MEWFIVKLPGHLFSRKIQTIVHYQRCILPLYPIFQFILIISSIFFMLDISERGLIDSVEF